MPGMAVNWIYLVIIAFINCNDLLTNNSHLSLAINLDYLLIDLIAMYDLCWSNLYLNTICVTCR